MKSTQPLAVVGAGIAGLAAALAFAARGFEVDVHERAAQLDEAGAGIQLSPNALRVMDRLGLLAALRAGAVQARQVVLRDLRSGGRLASVPVHGRDGMPYLSLTRSHLQRVLLDAARECPSIRLRTGSELVGTAREGTEITLRFRDGDVTRSVAVAADGVGSKLAASFGHTPATPTGAVAWRLTLEADPSTTVSDITAWLAPRSHVVAYPIDKGGGPNVVVVAPADAGDPRPFLHSGDRFIGSVVAAFGRATPWPLAACDRPRRSADPPGLLLVGDAAHAMAPYAAQGAALAIEDGFVAAACLADAPDAGTAWQRFETVRRPRWERVRRRVAFHRLVYHLPFPLTLGRNFALRARSQAALREDLAWLYDWAPPGN